MTLKTFEELEAWQASRELAREVYRVSRVTALRRDRSLCDQARRAAVSVMANLAEGFERGGRREFVHYVSQAGGSLGELRSHLYVAFDAGLLGAEELESLQKHAKRTGEILGGLRRYLLTTLVAGSKFKRG